MKDKKNIETLNTLVLYYISLHGLQGVALSEDSPFIKHFSNMFMGNIIFGIRDKLLNGETTNNIITVPNQDVHSIINKAYIFYREIDKLVNIVDPLVKEQIIQQLGDIEYDEFIENSVDIYKKSLFQILDNYNSNKLGYNLIKIKIYNDRLKNCIGIEDYETASEIKDKINRINFKIKKTEEN